MKKRIKTIIFVVVVILTEIFVFNFRYFEVKLSNLKEKEIKVEDAYIINEQYENTKLVHEIEIPLNEEIKNVRLNMDTKTIKNVLIEIEFIDKSQNYEWKKLDNIIYNNKYKNSNYIVLNSKQECQKIRLKIYANSKVNLNSITVNTWYFDFNIIRVIVILLVGILIANFKKVNNFFDKNKIIQNITYGIIIGGISIAFSIYAIKFANDFEEYLILQNKVFCDAYKLLTEALMDGRVNIETDEFYAEPLLELDNYRDFSERKEKGIVYLFDIAFYNGKYYCYYSIVPVLTVMLPIALIFNKVLKSFIACIVYCIGCLLLVFLIYKKILKKYNLEISFLQELLGYLALFSITGIPVVMTYPNFYSAVYFTGIFYGLLGTLLIMQLENNKHTIAKLIMIGISYGLMVCSRPILIFYIIPLAIAIYPYIVQEKKIKIKKALAIIIPIVIIAILQMYYNYIRFDNVFEFGQFYQLTINNPVDQKMDIGMSIEGVLAYLFNPPAFTSTFPFIVKNIPSVNNGNEIFTSELYGLMWFPYFWILLDYKQLKNNSKKLNILWYILIGISLIILSVDTCLAGINQRYLLDIQPAIALFAYVMWVKYLKNGEKEERIKEYKLANIVTVLIILFMTLNGLSSAIVSKIYSKDYINKTWLQYNIERLIFFYK